MEKNYLPLFRKYRPQSFEDIVGQENLVKALTNAITLNRIANAYLFCGPRGTGKTSTARIFAKSLNCVEGPTLTPCQKCPSCVDITNASGLDVIEIDAASNRGIQDAKDLISQVQYAPINGKYKIFIIDEVHMLSNEAFNALLKTFEEPPENVIFILATTEPHKVLETIVSRCQRFDLRRITTEDIVSRLRYIADKENIKITDSALYTIAKNVSGGLRDSIALLDQVSILGTKEEIDKNVIEELLGKINFDTLLELLNFINEGDIEHTLLKIDDIYTKGAEPRNLIENFIEFLRNIILILNSSDDESIINFTNLIKHDIDHIRSLSFNKDTILKILNIAIEYYKEIKVSTNPYLWMELAGIAMAKPIDNVKQIQPTQTTKINTINPIAKPQIDAIPKEVIQNTPIKPNNSDTPKPKTEEIEKVQEIQPEKAPQSNTQGSVSPDTWAKIVGAIQSIPSRAFYSGVGKLVSVEGNTITVGFLNENLMAQAKTDSKMAQLNQAISNAAPGVKVEFTVISSDTKTISVKVQPMQSSQPQTPARSVISQNQETQNKTLSQAQTQTTENKTSKVEADEDDDEKEENTIKHYNPKVQDMIEQFHGRIIE